MGTQASRSRSPKFAVAVLTCVAVGLAAGVFASGAKQPPSYALESTLIYRGEIGFAVFMALYFLVVLTRLAYYGRSITSIGAGGAQLPDVGLLSDAVEETHAAAAGLRKVGEELSDELILLKDRVAELERARPAKGDHGR
jgi:hypothetical protein